MTMFVTVTVFLLQRKIVVYVRLEDVVEQLPNKKGTGLSMLVVCGTKRGWGRVVWSPHGSMGWLDSWVGRAMRSHLPRLVYKWLTHNTHMGRGMW